MKLFNAIIAAAVVSAPFVSSTPAEAYVSPSEKLCNTSNCGMSVRGFTERMAGATGAKISFSEGRDKECRMSKYLGGYYSPSRHEIVLCNENSESPREIARTIVHEVVHAYQACIKGPVPFGHPNIDNHLTAREAHYIAKSYPKSQHWMEVNARKISNLIADEDFFAGATLQSRVDQACGDMKSAMRSLGSTRGIRKLH